MSSLGTKNRQKGTAQEYRVAKFLKEIGYNARRQPMSGALKGLKGDVVITLENKDEIKFEVKSRKKYFKKFYEVYEKNYDVKKNQFVILLEEEAAIVSDSPIITDTEMVARVLRDTGLEKKLTTMKKKWLKECDHLVIHQNYKPFLFIKYVGNLCPKKI